jgi:hypothetical protein
MNHWIRLKKNYHLKVSSGSIANSLFTDNLSAGFDRTENGKINVLTKSTNGIPESISVSSIACTFLQKAGSNLNNSCISRRTLLHFTEKERSTVAFQLFHVAFFASSNFSSMKVVTSILLMILLVQSISQAQDSGNSTKRLQKIFQSS